MTQSHQSKIIFKTLKLLRFKNFVEKKALKSKQKRKTNFIPRFIKRSFYLETKLISSKTIATFKVKNIYPNKHIIFFHGGGYIFNATRGHWKFAQQIVNKGFSRMSLFDYPLAPENSYIETHLMIEAAYKHLLHKFPNDEIIFMGDSAGGGLAMAFAQKIIKEQRIKPPHKIILLSPWLDISCSNPELKENEKSDSILTIKLLKQAALYYSRGENPKNFLLSPIYGNLHNLPDTIIFYGTDELLKADSISLKKKVERVASRFIFKEYSNMQHDWIIFPIPEREKVIKEICKFISSKTHNKL